MCGILADVCLNICENALAGSRMSADSVRLLFARYLISW